MPAATRFLKRISRSGGRNFSQIKVTLINIMHMVPTVLRACWHRHEEGKCVLREEGECASPDGVRSVVSGRVEHGEDTHEAEGLIVELNCYAQCLVSSLIQ